MSEARRVQIDPNSGLSPRGDGDRDDVRPGDPADAPTEPTWDEIEAIFFDVLERYVRPETLSDDPVIFDLGCGSGVLSIAAGCGYVPTNESFPAERNMRVLRRSKVTQVNLSRRCGISPAQVTFREPMPCTM